MELRTKTTHLNSTASAVMTADTGSQNLDSLCWSYVSDYLKKHYDLKAYGWN